MSQPARYLLTWYDWGGAIDPETLVPIRRALEDQVKEPREQVEIDLWLESGGGQASSAYKLALMLRHAAGRVRVVIPDYAKSAATLLALVGHEIFMAPGAELGPLDTQLREEGSLFDYTSALNIAKAADDLGRDAVALALRGGAEILRYTHLSRAQTLREILRFASDFSEPLVRQLDPKVVYDAKQALKSSSEYARRLLASTCENRADRIAAQLVEGFPTHGFVIGYEDAEQLGLPVHPVSEYDLWEEAKRSHRKCEDGQVVCVRFCSLEEFRSEYDGGRDDEGSKKEQDDQPTDSARSLDDDLSGVHYAAPEPEG